MVCVSRGISYINMASVESMQDGYDKVNVLFHSHLGTGGGLKCVCILFMGTS